MTNDLTKDVRDVNDTIAVGMFQTGGQLLIMAVVFGGSAFFLQWAVYFIAAGWAVHSIVRRGADAADWIGSKLPTNPFTKKTSIPPIPQKHS